MARTAITRGRDYLPCQSKRGAPRLRRSYIGSLSSRVGTIESRRSVDVIDSDHRQVCSRLRGAEHMRRPRRRLAPNCGRPAGEWGFATSAREPSFRLAHLGRDA